MTAVAKRKICSGMLNANVVGTLGEIETVVATAHHEARQRPPAPYIAKRLGEPFSRKKGPVDA